MRFLRLLALFQILIASFSISHAQETKPPSAAASLAAASQSDSNRPDDLVSSYDSVENNAVEIHLTHWQIEGNQLVEYFSTIAEMKGRIAFNSKGIVSGVDSLRRLKFATNNNGNWIWGNWLNITKCELVDGTAVVSTQDGDTYTIFAFTTSAFKGQIIKHETEEWKLFQRLGPDRWPR